MPDDPSFYIHVPTVTDSSLAPQGSDILYVLVPVPNLKGTKAQMIDNVQEQRIKDTVFQIINHNFLKLDLKRIKKILH